MKQCLDCSLGKIHFRGHGPYPGRKLTMIFSCVDDKILHPASNDVMKQTGKFPFPNLGYYNVFHLDYWIRFCKDDYWDNHVCIHPEKWVNDESIRRQYTPEQKSWVRKMIRESRNPLGCKVNPQE